MKFSRVAVNGIDLKNFEKKTRYIYSHITKIIEKEKHSKNIHLQNKRE